MRLLKACFTFIFLTGLVLLAFNLAGLVLPLRHPDIYTEAHMIFEDDITLTEAQFYDAIAPHQRSDVSHADYATTVNQAVQQGIAHYWPEEQAAANKHHWRIPLHENYLLFLMSYIYPKMYERYEYCDHHKAIERGVGLCSQHAIIFTGVLQERGIPARIVALSDLHVVATAQVEPDSETWWIFDPDYGVVIHHDMDAIKADPALVAPYYREAGYSAATADEFVTWYRMPPIYIHEKVADYCSEQKVKIERITYTLKWVIPFVFLGIGALPHIQQWRTRRSQA